MKKLCAGLLVLVVAAGAQAKVPKLILGEKDGLPVECEVCGYDVEKGLVKLRAGTKAGSKPFDSFSTNAQQRIVAWATDEAFESTADLKVTITKFGDEIEERSEGENNSWSSTEGEIVLYEICIENTTPFEMKGIRVEYRIFYEKTERGYRSYATGASQVMKDKEFKLYRRGEDSVDISCGELGRVSTGFVQITEFQSMDISQQGNVVSKEVSGKLLGMHVSLVKVAENGDELRRELTKGRVPRENKWDEYKDDKNGN